MTELISWCLAVFGTAFIIVFSSIFRPVRDYINPRIPFLGKLLSCILCTGFHAGWIWGWMIYSPALQVNPNSNFIIRSIFDGCIGAIVSWVGFLSIRKNMEGL